MAFLNLGTRGKAILAIGIILVLCLLGVLGYLVKTGKIKSSADTLSNNITVTVSGNASDRNLNKPIGNAQVSIKPLGLPAVTVATDATGNYKKSITVNKTDQTQNIVSVAISSPDYPQIIDSSYVDLSIPSDAKTGFSVTQNFSLGKTDDYDLIHNRLVNGDFEFGDLGYSKTINYNPTETNKNATSEIIKSSECYGGSGTCLKQSGGTSIYNALHQTPAGKLTSGKTYRFSIQYKTVGAKSTDGAVIGFRATKSTYTSFKASTEWKTVYVDMPVTDVNANENFFVGVYGTGIKNGYILVDNLDLYQLPSNTVADQEIKLNNISKSDMNIKLTVTASPTGSWGPLDRDVVDKCLMSDPNNFADVKFPLTGEKINDVVFCVNKADMAFLKRTDELTIIAYRLKDLSALTKLKIPPLYLLTHAETMATGVISATGQIPAGYFDFSTNSIYFNVDDTGISKNRDVAGHEFGHYVDWMEGPKTIKSNTFSTSNSDNFIGAFGNTRKFIVTGYAATNEREMFAEIFSRLTSEDEISKGDFRNSIIGLYASQLNPSITDISNLKYDYQYNTDNNTVSTFPPNCLLYIYSYVQNAANLPNYFKADLKSKFTLYDINHGKFLSTAIAYIKFTFSSDDPARYGHIASCNELDSFPIIPAVIGGTTLTSDNFNHSIDPKVSMSNITCDFEAYGLVPISPGADGGQTMSVNVQLPKAYTDAGYYFDLKNDKYISGFNLFKTYQLKIKPIDKTYVMAKNVSPKSDTIKDNSYMVDFDNNAVHQINYLRSNGGGELWLGLKATGDDSKAPYWYLSLPFGSEPQPRLTTEQEFAAFNIKDAMVVFKNIMSQTDSNYTRLVDKNNSTPLYYGFQKFTVSQEYSVVERSFVGINVEAGTPVAEAALQIPTESNKDLSPFDIIVFNKDPAGLTDEALFKSLDI